MNDATRRSDAAGLNSMSRPIVFVAAEVSRKTWHQAFKHFVKDVCLLKGYQPKADPLPSLGPQDLRRLVPKVGVSVHSAFFQFRAKLILGAVCTAIRRNLSITCAALTVRPRFITNGVDLV